MKIIAAAIAMLAFCAPARVCAEGVGQEGASSRDCYPSHNKKLKGVEYCEPSIIRLIARSEDYNDRHVKITGFLVQQSGYYMLFPSRGYWEATRGSGGVELLTDKDVPFDIRTLADGGGVDGVTVVGLFDAMSPARVHGSAGLVRNVENMFISPLFPH